MARRQPLVQLVQMPKTAPRRARARSYRRKSKRRGGARFSIERVGDGVTRTMAWSGGLGNILVDPMTAAYNRRGEGFAGIFNGWFNTARAVTPDRYFKVMAQPIYAEAAIGTRKLVQGGMNGLTRWARNIGR